MRIPLSWLKEYLPLENLSPETLSRTLTLAGLEVEDCEQIGQELDAIIVAEVLESQRHPNADKLSLTKVFDGTSTYSVICGAPNCRSGLKVALARVGTVLKENNESYTIKKAKIRGVESEGMLCSEEELGLSSRLFPGGILELPLHAPVGQSLKDFLGETYFEISLTPNLSHCMSVAGVARELAALLKLPLNKPSFSLQETPPPAFAALKVYVEDEKACPRYTCRVLRGVKVGPSPLWLKERLEACGFRSINNVVDATNYLLFETGHPLHAFDYAKIGSETLIVRQAKEGESLITLDDKERLLTPGRLVIADATRPLAIAGVMGGKDSEVTDSTTDIVLEAAYFDPLSIRRTSKKLGLQTEASKRFERGVDPNYSILDRAAAFIQELAGGHILEGVIEVANAPIRPIIIDVRLSRIRRLLGRLFSASEVEDIFKRLSFAYRAQRKDNDDVFSVEIPTYRRDISQEVDLIEEVARLYGYDHLPRKGQGYRASTLPVPPLYLFSKKVAYNLISEGLQEFLTCDLIGPTLLHAVFPTPADEIRVLNPTSVEQSILRPSLLPNLLQVVRHNLDRQNKDIAGFEVGQIHLRASGENEGYQEQSVVGIVLSGHSRPSHWSLSSQETDFFDLKGIAENLLASLGIENFVSKNLALETFHPGRQASIFVDSIEIGSIGEIHPAIRRRLSIDQRVFYGEFNLNTLQRLTPIKKGSTPLPLYPSSERDLTLTLKKSVPYRAIEEAIKNVNSPLLESFSLKDIYTSDKLPEACHNLTLHFVYRDSNGTVEQEAVEKEHDRLKQAIEFCTLPYTIN